VRPAPRPARFTTTGIRPALVRALTHILSWRVGSLAFRSLHRYLSINGTQRALVLAAQAFSTLIPLLIVVSTLFSAQGGLQVADDVIARFRLSGNSAEAVRTLFAQPPGSTQNITVGSAVLLVISGLSLARTIQRTYESAWQLPARGLRGAFGGVAALILLLTQVLLLSLLAQFLRAVPAGSFLILVLRAAAASALWLALQYLLLGGRVAWRRLLPGGIACGVGQQAVAAVSTLWIPAVIEQNATRYGTIGVSFALLSWLVVISVVLVLAAVLSVELGGGPPLPSNAAVGPLRAIAGLLGAQNTATDLEQGENGRPGPEKGPPVPRPAGPPEGAESAGQGGPGGSGVPNS
jgi:membrane protein